MRRHPEGLRTLFFTELWERFSYYGMRALLVLFLVEDVQKGGLGLSTHEAALIYGNYTMAVYMVAIPGGLLADRVLGPSTAVLMGGGIIALGHFSLAFSSSPTFYLGLSLIVLGTGLFKPNISVLVGKLYDKTEDLRDSGFSIFYMGINIGAFFAPLMTGFLAQSSTFKSFLQSFGLNPNTSWHYGFAAAGFGMLIGLWFFQREHKTFHTLSVTTEAEGQDSFPLSYRQSVSLLVLTITLASLFVLSDQPGYSFVRYLILAVPFAAIFYFMRHGSPKSLRFAAALVFLLASVVFWAIFEQAGLSIALFADQLTRSEILGVGFPSTWFQSLNSLFVILLAPVFASVWARMGARQPSSPTKFSLGLLFLSLSFLLMVPAALLTEEGLVSPFWLVGLFLLQTVGELFLSPVGLSTMTKLAPSGSAGVLLGVWFLGSAFGNKLASILGSQFQSTHPQELADFFLVQALCVAVAAFLMFILSPLLQRWMAEVRAVS